MAAGFAVVDAFGAATGFGVAAGFGAAAAGFGAVLTVPCGDGEDGPASSTASTM
jgi:hypothetical protein